MNENRLNTIFLHVGLSKTGTTWLQEKIFPKLDNVDYVSIEKSSEIFTSMLKSGKKVHLHYPFNLSPYFWREYGDDFINKLLSLKKNSVLLSDENITLGRGAFRSGETKHAMSFKDPFMLKSHLQELQKVCSKNGEIELKVMLVIRKQDEWLASRYAQSSKFIVNASQSDFKYQTRELLGHGAIHYQEGQWIDYSKVYEQIVEALGEENVLLVPYEMLKDEPKVFVNKIEKFTDSTFELNGRGADDVFSKTNVRSKKSKGKKLWKLRGKGIGLLGSKINKKLEGFKIFDKYISLPDTLSKKILESCRDGNEKLSKRLDLGLEKYGYYR